VLLSAFFIAGCKPSGGKEAVEAAPVEAKAPPNAAVGAAEYRKPTVNVYMANTRSMYGFLRGDTEFKKVVREVITEVVDNWADSINTYYINGGGIAKYTGRRWDFTEKRHAESARTKTNTRDVNIIRQIDTIFARQENFVVSVFVTDGMGNDSTMEDRRLIRSAIRNYMREKDNRLAVKVYQMNSAFNGTVFRNDHARDKGKIADFCYRCMREYSWIPGVPPTNKDTVIASTVYDENGVAGTIYKDTTIIIPGRAGYYEHRGQTPDGVCAAGRDFVAERPYYIWVIGNEKYVDEFSAKLTPQRLTDNIGAGPVNVFYMKVDAFDEFGFIESESNDGNDRRFPRFSLSPDRKIMTSMKRVTHGANKGEFEFVIGLDLSKTEYSNADTSEITVKLNEREAVRVADVEERIVKSGRSAKKAKWYKSSGLWYSVKTLPNGTVDGYTHMVSIVDRNKPNRSINLSELTVSIAMPRNSWINTLNAGNLSDLHTLREPPVRHTIKTFSINGVLSSVNEAFADGDAGGLNLKLKFENDTKNRRRKS
jgi:hypothetical protein